MGVGKRRGEIEERSIVQFLLKNCRGIATSPNSNKNINNKRRYRQNGILESLDVENNHVKG
jgi:hypothetical protein